MSWRGITAEQCLSDRVNLSGLDHEGDGYHGPRICDRRLAFALLGGILETPDDLDDLSVSPRASVRQAIRAIDQGAIQVALVVDDRRRLLGTVTDGDIRRGLLAGETLDSPIERVMQSKFRSLPADASEDDAHELMRRAVLHQVPALDDQGRVVRLFTLEDVLNRRVLRNWVVLMAGGEGTRLRPLTDSLPKPMVSVAGRPMLEITVERCVKAGFREIFLSVNYLKENIVDHFGDGSRLGADVRYLDEVEPLGTAGSLRLLPERPNQPILVVNGDVLSRVDFGALLRFHATHGASATLCVRAHQTQILFGVVHADGLEVKSMEEKPVLTHYVNAGIYVINPELLDLLPPDQPCDMPQLLELALGQGMRVSVFPVHEYWLDVGSHERLNQANVEW